MKNKKIAVIGAGAAGMMAGYYAKINGAEVTIFEKNEKAGKKLFITGKGRCNVTNAADVEEIFDNIVTNKKFLFSAIYSFTNQDLMNLLEENGLKLKVERGNRVFPASDYSSDVINTLKKMLKNAGVNVVYNTEIKDLIVEDGNCTGVIDDNNKKMIFDAVIIATGGVSYPVTGSDGKGLEMAVKHGHSVKELRPSLVPMNILEEYPKDLQGLSLKNVNVSFYEQGKKKKIYEDFGEMLFTHFGVSGPVILSASSKIGTKIKNGNVTLSIDLKPALSVEELDARILRDFNENINKDLRNSLDKLLPKKLIPVIISIAGLDPYKKVNNISKEEREKLLSTLKNLRMSVSSLRGFNEAIITAGGINVKEVDPSTMESKIINNLFICGEMLDVDAYTGGFNLQIAWSTGKLAGESAAVLKE